jgi:hypothetical protein
LFFCRSQLFGALDRRGREGSVEGFVVSCEPAFDHLAMQPWQSVFLSSKAL